MTTDTLTPGQMLRQAIAHHRANRLQEAERLYRAILQTWPHHPDANHNLGVLAVQVKRPADGLPYFKAALEAKPEHGQFWLSYAEALLAAGRAGEALDTIRGAIQRGLATEAAQALREKAEAAAQDAHVTGSAGAFDRPGQLQTTQNGGLAELLKASKAVAKKGKPARKKTPPTKAAPSRRSLPLAECNRLVDLFDAGRHAELEQRARVLIGQYPDSGFVWKVWGASLREQGKDALPAMQKAVALSPEDAEAHNNLGNALRDIGRLDAAVASYRRALELSPDYAKMHYNLGNALRNLGQLDAAVACHRRALELRPDFAEALNELAMLFDLQGKTRMALDAVRQSLQYGETDEAKKVFVACVKNSNCAHIDSGIRGSMMRALTEPWGRADRLAHAALCLVKLDPDIGECLSRSNDAWPARLPAQDLFGSNGLAALAGDQLLCALLDAAPICNLEVERFLTMARCALLEAATGTAAEDKAGAALTFYCALARQCFINEYVFACTDGEMLKASELRAALSAALETEARVPVLWLVAVAAYFPLHAIPLASRLLEQPWPEEVAAVLAQQVREPAEELQLRATMPRLTGIEGDVSLLVQNQYEENPYPRWIRATPAGEAKDVAGYLSQMFPLAVIGRYGKTGDIEVLIAGCGTGQHSIRVAQQFKGAQVLAIDLSMSSLGYAKRKTRELGIKSIEYAQADLLKLGSLGRSFDVIESVGVLHHLVDPWAGWRVLLSLLRPGGFMKLGFYSEAARRNIVRIRALIAERGYGSSASEIRRCRQDLVDLDKSADFGVTLKSSDFFSISACRDLLFHVQEHRMTLTGIDAFLRENNLTFLGFEIDPGVLHAYRLRFPEDRAAVSLEQWQVFENENPDTFFGMYQFWVQKADQELARE